jgi:hypothetical protein
MLWNKAVKSVFNLRRKDEWRELQNGELQRLYSLKKINILHIMERKMRERRTMYDMVKFINNLLSKILEGKYIMECICIDWRTM